MKDDKLKRIAIISHSVCLPREDTELSHIYPKLLQSETSYDLTLIGVGGGYSLICGSI
jgi:hypothetical protein